MQTIEYTKGQLDEAVETKSPIIRLKTDLQEDGRLWLLKMNASEHQYQGLENLLCNFLRPTLIGGLRKVYLWYLLGQYLTH